MWGPMVAARSKANMISWLQPEFVPSEPTGRRWYPVVQAQSLPDGAGRHSYRGLLSANPSDWTESH